MENWKNISAGWLLGLFEDPNYNSTNCTECWNFGENMGLLNFGVVYVEGQRDQWIDQSEVTNLDVFEISSKLLDIYVMFLTVLLPIDNIVQDKKLVQIPKKIFTVFFDRDVYKQILANILEKGTEMAVLLITIPGASCYSIGYRVAVFTRFLFNIIYDEDKEMPLEDNTYELDEEVS